MLIYNAKIITPYGPADWLLYDGQTIQAIGRGLPPQVEREHIDGRGMTLLPGFIDIHIHGSAGYDVMDATPEALTNMAQFIAQHGVTSFLPTTLTNPHNLLMQALENVKTVQEKHTVGAAIVGAHLEGPYLNAEKCGAQNPQYIRLAKPHETEELLGLNILRLVDIAPEFDDNRALIAECAKVGIAVSVAHSSATYKQTIEAIELGLSHSTHTFNAQTPLLHREPGIVGAVLSSPQVTCELIADNIHVHPAAMKIAWLCKKPHHLVLISDAVRAAGMPDGEYQFDERKVILSNGAVRLPDSTLAGSVLTMDKALYNLMQATGEPLENIWQTASLNPARAIGISHLTGSIEVGKLADLVLVDEHINVMLTVVHGKPIYKRETRRLG